MAKYVIEIPSGIEWIQYIQQTGHGTINLKVESVSDLTPYTEPDEIKNNKVNLCTSCELYEEHFPECGDVDVLFGDGVGNDNICCCSGYVAKNEDGIRQKVEQEVWEFASKLMNMHSDVAEDIYWSMNGGKGIGVAAEMSYQDAKARYEEWRKQKDEIRVGDEVQYSLAGYEYMFIVFGKEKDVLYGMRTDKVDMDDICEAWDYCNKSDSTLEKTGRHFPEVAELLKKMREE